MIVDRRSAKSRPGAVLDADRQRRLRLRRRRPDLPRPFRTPGYPIVPAVFLVGTGLLTAAVFYERPVVSTIALLSILAGVPVYYLRPSGGDGGARGVGPDRDDGGTDPAGAHGRIDREA